MYNVEFRCGSALRTFEGRVKASTPRGQVSVWSPGQLLPFRMVRWPVTKTSPMNMKEIGRPQLTPITSPTIPCPAKGQTWKESGGQLSSNMMGSRVTPTHCECPGIQRCHRKAFLNEYFSKVTMIEQTEHCGHLCQMP